MYTGATTHLHAATAVLLLGRALLSLALFCGRSPNVAPLYWPQSRREGERKRTRSASPAPHCLSTTGLFYSRLGFSVCPPFCLEAAPDVR
ncbi:hypothetical protein NDU88_002806, partial [Pleurodeles waltl]